MIVWLWLGFILFVLTMLALDLGLLNRHARVIKTREALIWSGFCAVLAMGFNVLIYFIYQYKWLGVNAAGETFLPGREAALQFFTGWVIEQSLSLDNIFVIALIFSYFRIPVEYQHRALFWGIVGALVMRAGMILAGAALMERFDWINYVFGGLLFLTAIKMLRAGDEDIHPDRNIFVRIARRFYPVTSELQGEKFFARVDGRTVITPLFLVLLVIESTDVLFAVDSIPAIFAVTRDSFIVFTSNVFAILNLRSLYFALADLMERFKYLKTSLVFILAFVGVKLMLAHHFPIPTYVTLVLVGAGLAVGILSSLWTTRKEERRAAERELP